MESERRICKTDLLGRAAELLDLPWLDLCTRFLRLDVPLRRDILIVVGRTTCWSR